MTNMPTPLVSTENEEFWDAAVRGKLVLKMCRSCGATHHYPRAVCPFCHSGDTVWTEAKGTGVVHSYSVMRREKPVTVPAYVALDEGILMMTSLVNCDPADVRIGMSVKVCFADAEDGIRVPVFQPA